MTDPVRAALESAEFALSVAVNATSDDRSWYEEACKALDRVQAALTPPASPEPERPCPDGDSCPDARRFGSIHPAAPTVEALTVGIMTAEEYQDAFGEPAAPTVEALRDALVKDVIDAYQVDAVGRVIYDPPTFRDRLIELEAAARADERTRLSGRHGPRGGSWPGRTR